MEEPTLTAKELLKHHQSKADFSLQSSFGEKVAKSDGSWLETKQVRHKLEAIKVKN